MKKLPALIALFCILVYAGSLIYGAYRVYASIQNQKQQAVTELDGIQNRITQSVSDFYTQPFREEIRKFMVECSALQGIIITGSQVSLAFEKKAGEVINNDPNPGFISRFGYANLQARQIDIPGSRNVNIYSIFNALDYENLVLVLRQTLFAILAALLVSFLTMIITMLRSRSSNYAGTSFAEHGKEEVKSEYSSHNEYSSDEYSQELDNSFSDVFNETEEPAAGDSSSDSSFSSIEDENFDDTGFDSSGYDDIDDSGINNDFSASESGDFASETAGGENNNDTFDLPDFDDFSETETSFSSFEDNESSLDDAASKDDDFSLNDFLDEEDLSLPERLDEQPPVSPSSPNGLYSQRSNLGWEAYTEDRLASELHRCASSEQDLVVLLMECGDNVQCDAKLYKKIADEAVDLFNLHDLTFEYGNRGITVIIPNSGLEQGIAKAEAFHSRLFHNQYDSFRSKNDFLTGISSRSGRLIAADRLLQEAKKALEKAKAEELSPIVAFKSDPEKYREYVKKSALQD